MNAPWTLTLESTEKLPHHDQTCKLYYSHVAFL